MVLEPRARRRVALDDDGKVVERAVLGDFQHVMRREPELLEELFRADEVID